MISDEKYKTYFEYRYLIDNVLQEYSQDSPDYEDLYDAGIAGLFHAINEIHENNIDFKSFALFHIKSEINKKINDKD